METILKLATTTIGLVEQLSEEERALLDERLKEHIRLCRKNGAPIESLDRFIIEGIEVMRLEQRFPIPADAEYEEPHYSYPQYVSPKGDS